MLLKLVVSQRGLRNIAPRRQRPLVRWKISKYIPQTFKQHISIMSLVTLNVII